MDFRDFRRLVEESLDVLLYIEKIEKLDNDLYSDIRDEFEKKIEKIYFKKIEEIRKLIDEWLEIKYNNTQVKIIRLAKFILENIENIKDEAFQRHNRKIASALNQIKDIRYYLLNASDDDIDENKIMEFNHRSDYIKSLFSTSTRYYKLFRYCNHKKSFSEGNLIKTSNDYFIISKIYDDDEPYFEGYKLKKIKGENPSGTYIKLNDKSRPCKIHILKYAFIDIIHNDCDEYYYRINTKVFITE